MLEKTLIIIEYIDGIKSIHYSGFGYCAEYPIDKPYKWVEYVWLICPLMKAIKYGVDKWEEDNREFVKQYIQDLSEEEVQAIVKQEDWNVIKVSDITVDIPCGTYWLAHN